MILREPKGIKFYLLHFYFVSGFKLKIVHLCNILPKLYSMMQEKLHIKGKFVFHTPKDSQIVLFVVFANTIFSLIS